LQRGAEIVEHDVDIARDHRRQRERRTAIRHADKFVRSPSGTTEVGARWFRARVATLILPDWRACAMNSATVLAVVFWLTSSRSGSCGIDTRHEFDGSKEL
jgi:hypothetical protein